MTSFIIESEYTSVITTRPYSHSDKFQKKKKRKKFSHSNATIDHKVYDIYLSRDKQDEN